MGSFISLAMKNIGLPFLVIWKSAGHLGLFNLKNDKRDLNAQQAFSVHASTTLPWSQRFSLIFLFSWFFFFSRRGEHESRSGEKWFSFLAASRLEFAASRKEEKSRKTSVTRVALHRGILKTWQSVHPWGLGIIQGIVTWVSWRSRFNFVPRVSHLTGGKMRDPGNEVVIVLEKLPDLIQFSKCSRSTTQRRRF